MVNKTNNQLEYKSAESSTLKKNKLKTVSESKTCKTSNVYCVRKQCPQKWKKFSSEKDWKHRDRNHLVKDEIQTDRLQKPRGSQTGHKSGVCAENVCQDSVSNDSITNTLEGTRKLTPCIQEHGDPLPTGSRRRAPGLSEQGQHMKYRNGKLLVQNSSATKKNCFKNNDQIHFSNNRIR